MAFHLTFGEQKMKRRTIFAYIIVFSLVIAIFLFLQFILNKINFLSSGISNVFALFITLLLFNPLLNIVRGQLEKVMNKKHIFFLSQITQLKEEVTYITHLLRLQRVLIRRIAEVLRIQVASLFIYNKSSNIYELCDGIGITQKDKRKIQFKPSGGLLVWLRMDKKSLYFSKLLKDKRFEYLGKEEKEKLRKLQADICIPLLLGTEVVGILFLGRKPNKESYSNEEIQLVQDIANQAAQSIINATAQRDITSLEREINRYQNRIKHLETRLNETQQAYQNLLDYLKTGIIVIKLGNKTVELGNTFRESILPELNELFKDHITQQIAKRSSKSQPPKNSK